MTVRLCRSLVWVQAMFAVLAGLFVVAAAVLFGSGNSVPFGSSSLTGSAAAILGGVYVLAGFALVYLGVELGRLASWARTAIVSLEVFLAVLLFFRTLEFSVSIVVNVCLYVAIIGLLFAPSTSAALLNRPKPVASAGTAPAPTEGEAPPSETLPLS